jgi:hypothetical protein
VGVGPAGVQCEAYLGTEGPALVCCAECAESVCVLQVYSVKPIFGIEFQLDEKIAGEQIKISSV